MNNLECIYVEVNPLNAAPVAKFSYKSFLSEDDKQTFRQYTNYTAGRAETAPYISNTYALFEDLSLTRLRDKFNLAIKQYVEQVLMTPHLQFKNVGSWLTKNVLATKHHSHPHPNSMLSVVTYFDDNIPVREEMPGIVFTKDTFSNIFPSFNFDFSEMENTGWNIFNYETFSIRPKQHDVIVFPSHLMHQSESNTSASRFCIGGNYFVTGALGSASKSSALTLTL